MTSQSLLKRRDDVDIETDVVHSQRKDTEAALENARLRSELEQRTKESEATASKVADLVEQLERYRVYQEKQEEYRRQQQELVQQQSERTEELEVQLVEQRDASERQVATLEAKLDAMEAESERRRIEAEEDSEHGASSSALVQKELDELLEEREKMEVQKAVLQDRLVHEMEATPSALVGRKRCRAASSSSSASRDASSTFTITTSSTSTTNTTSTSSAVTASETPQALHLLQGA